MADILLEIHQHDHTVLDTDSEQRNEADTRRNREIESGHQQRRYTAYRRERHVEQYQSCIPRITEQHKQDDKDNGDADRNYLPEPFGRTLLVLEIARPFERIACRNDHLLLYLTLRFGDSAAHVTPPHGKLHGTETGMIIPKNK